MTTRLSCTSLVSSTLPTEHRPEMSFIPQVPTTPRLLPRPPRSPVAFHSSIREGKPSSSSSSPASLQLPPAPLLVLALVPPTAPARIPHVTSFSFPSHSSRPAPASSPKAGWQSAMRFRARSSFSFLFFFLLKMGCRRRPGQTRVRPETCQWREDPQSCPKEEQLQFGRLTGSAQKFACPLAG